MSYHVAYVQAGKEGEAPLDGDTVASGTGYLAWVEWAAGRADDCPHAAHLAEEGWLEPAEALDALEGELKEMLDAHAEPNVRGVTARLLEAVRARPEDCPGLVVTDGTPGGDDEDEP